MKTLPQETQNWIEDKTLTPEKAQILSEIMDIVNRFSAAESLDQDKVEEMSNKFGVDSQKWTWGDYFAFEVGYSHRFHSLEELQRIRDMIRFDLVSSYLIFQGKDENFIETAKRSIETSKSLELWNEESIHLEVLLKYYDSLKMQDLDPSQILNDKLWYEGVSIWEGVA
jgi:hypothetical protein